MAECNNRALLQTERMYDVLEDADEVRDGAHSRNDSRADDRRDDFDFTFSDARFSEISDDNFDQDKYADDYQFTAIELGVFHIRIRRTTFPVENCFV